VTIEKGGNRVGFRSTSQHGVTTRAWATGWDTFAVVGGGASDARTVTWQTRQNELGGGATVRCPAGGTPSVVCGSGSYTTDSSVCTAAVHAGRISFAAGGVVTTRLAGTASGYVGSTNNGVTTVAWGPSWGQFTVE
jgi:hypothetical protein